MREFSIQSRQVLLESRTPPRPALIRVKEGKIEGVLEKLVNDPTFDLGDNLLMPGIVETHAHINEPGRTEWEGFETATKAAAAGGITTIVDMPLNSIPPTTSIDSLRKKNQAASGKCFIDYGFWGGLVRDNLKELDPMVDAGVCGFKAFLIDSGVPEFAWVREAELRAGMEKLARLRVPLLAHAEVDLGPEDGPQDPRAYGHYLATRPPKWEVEAIRLLVRLCRETGCAVHIVHLSASDALCDIAAAKKEGLPVTVETCPHYLTFSAENIPEGATSFKCAPPIRGEKNREALWKGLEQGVIDLVVSDHSPCTPSLKRLDSGNFDQAWGGIAGLQFSLSVTWSEMNRRGIPLERIAAWMMERPAKLAGLENRKGKIAVGLDADLVEFDSRTEFQVAEGEVLHRHRLTPYLNRHLKGRVTRTWLRGELVFDRGNFPSAPLGKEI